MNIKTLHRWDVSYVRARQLQRELAGRVRHAMLRKNPQILAGLDCAFTRDGQYVIAAVVVLRGPEFEVVEQRVARRRLLFPYIPGLLTFREGPACVAAVRKIRSQVDAFLVDGQGVAHPRRLGLAAHLGLFFDRPTIGCAKSRLIGEYDEPRAEKGRWSKLRDGQEVIGAVVRTRANVKPLFVSVGHRVRLADAVRVTLDCAVKYRLPEPTRLAHQLVSREKLKG